MIRRADERDREAVRRMAENFCALALLPVSSSSFDRAFNTLTTSPSAIIFVDDSGRSMLCGALVPWLLDDSCLIAQEIAWWVDPGARGGSLGVKLLNAFEDWAIACGAKFVSLSCIQHMDGDKVSRLYERKGYVFREQAWVKEMM